MKILCLYKASTGGGITMRHHTVTIHLDDGTQTRLLGGKGNTLLIATDKSIRELFLYSIFFYIHLLIFLTFPGKPNVWNCSFKQITWQELELVSCCIGLYQFMIWQMIIWFNCFLTMVIKEYTSRNTKINHSHSQ